MNIQTEHDSSLGAFQTSTNTSRGVYQHQRYSAYRYQGYGASFGVGGPNFLQSTSNLNHQPGWTAGHGSVTTGLPNKGNYGNYNYTNDIYYPSTGLLSFGFRSQD
ncbi:hypothetical protein R6Q59_032537 [Mikania micrantha]|uniref:Uncharacterized protein n=1 Tax=Mikania micrantha TaxID=192012 RepID=A0A5N6NR13_9ASTR|nr:hypothetical protein E3N88_17152 [Mikania micrantha]